MTRWGIVGGAVICAATILCLGQATQELKKLDIKPQMKPGAYTLKLEIVTGDGTKPGQNGSVVLEVTVGSADGKGQTVSIVPKESYSTDPKTGKQTPGAINAELRDGVEFRVTKDGKFADLHVRENAATQPAVSGAATQPAVSDSEMLMVARLAFPHLAYRPAQPVAVGDTWEAAVEETEEKARCTLKEMDGTKAVIKVQTSIKYPDGIEHHGTRILQYDVALGGVTKWKHTDSAVLEEKNEKILSTDTTTVTLTPGRATTLPSSLPTSNPASRPAAPK